jgi:hypothetical protein
MGELHVAEPAGTRIVSPLDAADTQSLTSVRLALAAVLFGLEPLQAAIASELQQRARTIKANHAGQDLSFTIRAILSNGAARNQVVFCLRVAWQAS